jgi:hypothetical protein
MKIEEARTLAQIKANKYGEVIGIYETKVNGSKAYAFGEVSTIKGRVIVEYVHSLRHSGESVLRSEKNDELRPVVEKKSKATRPVDTREVDGATGVLPSPDEQEGV